MVKCSPCMQLVQGSIPGPAKSNVIGKKCEGVRGREGPTHWPHTLLLTQLHPQHPVWCLEPCQDQFQEH